MSLSLPILALPYPLVLLPSAILRIPIDDNKNDRRDIQSLLAKLAYDALQRPRQSSQSSSPPSLPNGSSGGNSNNDKGPASEGNAAGQESPPGLGQEEIEFTIAFLPLDPYSPAATIPPSPSLASPVGEDTTAISDTQVHHYYRNLDPGSASLEDLCPIGTVGRVVGLEQAKVVPGRAFNGGVGLGAAILVEGKERCKIKNVLQKTPFMQAEVEILSDKVADPDDVELSSLHAYLQQLATTLVHLLRIPLSSSQDSAQPKHLPLPLARRLENFIASSPIHLSGRLADFLVAALDPPLQERLLILQDLDVKSRLKRVNGILEKKVEELKSILGGRLVVRQAAPPPPPPPTEIVMRKRIPPGRGGGTAGNLFGADDDADPELAQLENKLTAAKIPAHAQAQVDRELSRLKRMPTSQPEYSVQRTYLETLAEIPWATETEDKLDGEAMKTAKGVLDRDHFGLDKVKRRVLEYLAVLRLRALSAQEKEDAEAVEGNTALEVRTGEQGQITVGDAIPVDPTVSIVKPITALNEPSTLSRPQITRAPILLLVGQPGTGKTSLAKSIATALGRKFHRISLGGVHSEAEIRGHRRTYIAAMPGVVVNGLRKVGVANPVLLLDEIDKVGGRSHNGDPSAAMLEVLDPEQNWSFSDHYVNIPIDLSKVIFIATANDKRDIHPALLDRMETIHLHAYTNLEKFHIASRFLIPKQVALNGLSADQVQIPEQVIHTLITSYTREPGVRNLEREIGSVVRAKAVQYVHAKDSSSLGGYMPQVSLDELETILGIQKYRPDLTERGNRPGIANGLVAFSSGNGLMNGSGAIIYIEAAAMPGSEGLKLTGNLGSVIKESVEVALTWVKGHAYELGLTNTRDDDLTKNKSIHVHCPAGSDPKDGPSAGVAFIVALVSLFSDQPVPATLAMTGEVSLRGRVTAVGAIKEKLIGALSAGVKTVIVPARNRHDVQELPEEVKRGLKIVCVQHVWEVLRTVWPDWTCVATHDTLSAIGPISSRL